MLVPWKHTHSHTCLAVHWEEKFIDRHCCWFDNCWHAMFNAQCCHRTSNINICTCFMCVHKCRPKVCIVNDVFAPLCQSACSCCSLFLFYFLGPCNCLLTVIVVVDKVYTHTHAYIHCTFAFAHSIRWKFFKWRFNRISSKVLRQHRVRAGQLQVGGEEPHAGLTGNLSIAIVNQFYCFAAFNTVLVAIAIFIRFCPLSIDFLPYSVDLLAEWAEPM